MATDVNDLAETIGSTLGRLARDAAQNIGSDGHSGPLGLGRSNGALSGNKGVATGLALGVAAPVAAVGVGKMAKRAVLKRTGASSGKDVVQKAAEGVKGTVTDAVGKQVEQAGGASGMAKEAAKSMVPGLGGGEDEGGEGESKGQKGTPGVGKGRRMPIQQEVDIGVPLEVVYNQWTQFEEWPQFMHRLDQITQEDDCTVSFRTKVWGMSREFVAQIVEQRPDERIQWNVNQGVHHTGVVTFHELGPRLTRVLVTVDVEPGSLIEKAARGMRHIKRALRGDLHRFKAFIEMQEVETGAWRGTIHDGEVAEEHPKDYDSGRDYAEFDDIHDREHSHEPREPAAAASEARAATSRSSGSSSSRRKSSGSKSSASKSSGSRRKSGSRSSGRSRSGSSSNGDKSSSGRKRSGSSARSS